MKHQWRSFLKRYLISHNSNRNSSNNCHHHNRKCSIPPRHLLHLLLLHTFLKQIASTTAMTGLSYHRLLYQHLQIQIFALFHRNDHGSKSRTRLICSIFNCKMIGSKSRQNPVLVQRLELPTTPVTSKDVIKCSPDHTI